MRTLCTDLESQFLKKSLHIKFSSQAQQQAMGGQAAKKMLTNI